eukprot:3661763-Amphidinium_carterae.1
MPVPRPATAPAPPRGPVRLSVCPCTSCDSFQDVSGGLALVCIGVADKDVQTIPRQERLIAVPKEGQTLADHKAVSKMGTAPAYLVSLWLADSSNCPSSSVCLARQYLHSHSNNDFLPKRHLLLHKFIASGMSLIASYVQASPYFGCVSRSHFELSTGRG